MYVVEIDDDCALSPVLHVIFFSMDTKTKTSKKWQSLKVGVTEESCKYLEGKSTTSGIIVESKILVTIQRHSLKICDETANSAGRAK